MTYPDAVVPVGAGTLSLSPMPGKTGRLHEDLAAMKAGGAKLLVSLSEAAEFPKGEDAFRQAVMAAGFEWLWLPIADFATPDGVREAELRYLMARLQKGEQVALHCMGGCGRSGMIALRLMCMTGEPARDAMARLRELRPCAVETEAQEIWAMKV